MAEAMRRLTYEVAEERAPADVRRSAACRRFALRLPDAADDQCDRDEPRQRRAEEDRRQRGARGVEQGEGDERTDERAGVVHRPVESERSRAPFGFDRCGEQCVARRTTQPLADPIRRTHDADVPRRRGEREERASRSAKSVADDEERSVAAVSVRECPRHEAEHARDGRRDSLDPAERESSTAESLDEGGEQRHDHLRPQVGEQADQHAGALG